MRDPENGPGRGTPPLARAREGQRYVNGAPRESGTPPRAEVLVLDSASTDGSPELVRQRFRGIRLIVLLANVRFAGAANVSIRATAAPASCSSIPTSS